MDNAPSAYVPEKKHTVFVSGLPDNVDESRVLEVFVSFGEPAPPPSLLLHAACLLMPKGRRADPPSFRFLSFPRFRRHRRDPAPSREGKGRTV